MALWLLGLGVVLFTAVWENDWDRIRIASVSCVVLGALQLIAVFRYTSQLHGGPSTWLYVVALGITTLTGVIGVTAVRPSGDAAAAGHSPVVGGLGSRAPRLGLSALG